MYMFIYLYIFKCVYIYIYIYIYVYLASEAVWKCNTRVSSLHTLCTDILRKDFGESVTQGECTRESGFFSVTGRDF